MPYLDRNNSKLYYEEYGEGAPVIMAHGVGGNHASWFKQVPDFARKYRVILFDHRAFGNSTDVEETGRSSYLEDLLALIDHLDIEKANLIGQSMGGGTCAAFSCTYPGRVNSLIIADSLAGLKAPEPLASDLADVTRKTANLSQIERVLGPVMQQEDPYSSLLYLQIASFNSVTIKTVRGEPPIWTPDALASSGLPVLFIAGVDDVLFPAQLIQRTQKMIPGSQYVEIDRAGHSAYFENSVSFNRAVMNFLDATTKTGVATS